MAQSSAEVRFSLQWDRRALGPACWPVQRGRLGRLLQAALACVQTMRATKADGRSKNAHPPAPKVTLEVTLRMVGSKESQALNQQFRGRDAPTNVLTFNYEALPQASADLVLCLPVLQKEAHEQKKSVGDHFLHMALHGTLHALGFDHQTESEALTMEAHERQLLARFGIADPYRGG